MTRVTVPSQPMELAMPGVFGRRAQVKIRGTSLDGTAKYFTIQLTTTEGIALQMLIPTFGEIAMNSTQAGMWELEERYPNRIHVGHSFEIKIKNQGDYMEVKINGHHLASFFHRELPSKIKGLFVRGDISLKDVRFKNFKGSREGPAVMLHTNLPPQQAPLYIQRQSIALPIEVAASHQVYTEGPPPYPQDEFPLHSSPQKF